MFLLPMNFYNVFDEIGFPFLPMLLSECVALIKMMLCHSIFNKLRLFAPLNLGIDQDSTKTVYLVNIVERRCGIDQMAPTPPYRLLELIKTVYIW